MRTYTSRHYSAYDRFYTADVTDAREGAGGPHATISCEENTDFFAADTPAEVAALVQRKADALAALAAEIRQRHGIETPAVVLSAHDCTREGRM